MAVAPGFRFARCSGAKVRLDRIHRRGVEGIVQRQDAREAAFIGEAVAERLKRLGIAGDGHGARRVDRGDLEPAARLGDELFRLFRGSAAMAAMRPRPAVVAWSWLR